MTAKVVPAPAPASRWIFNPTVDLLVGCGGWSLPLLVITFYLSQRDAVHLSFVFYFLGVFINQPHYMATVYRAYHTPEDFRKYRFFTLYLTIFIGLTALVVHLAPALFPWLLTFYLTWSPWHYTGQNFGIAMMLARRAGAKPTEEDRQLIWWSYFASYVAWFLALHNVTTAGQPTLLILPIPEVWAQSGKLFFFFLFLCAGGWGHYRLIRQIGWRAMAGPLALFVTQFLWFLLPEVLRAFSDLQFPATYSSAGILAVMHCAQYLWITSYYAKREGETGEKNGTASRAGAFRWSPYYLLLVLGGIAMFLPGPWLASRVFGHDLVESFFIFTALINLHHFMLDGAIWKLRDGRIARLLLGRNPPLEEHRRAGDRTDDRPYLAWLLGPGTRAKWLRYTLATALLALATVDQTQFWLTQKDSSQPALALAQLVNPQDTRVFFQRAKSLVAAGESPAAIAELRQAIAINPHSIQTQHLLGELLFRAGDTAAARAHYDRMAALFPPDLAILINQGLLAGRQGQPAQARAYFEAALRLSPHRSELHLYIAETFEAEGDLSRTIELCLRYLELHVEDMVAPEVLPRYLNASLKIAALSLRQNRRDDAINWYRRVAELGRHTGRIQDVAVATARLRDLGVDP